MQILYPENYNIVERKDLTKWKDIFMILRINTVKMVILFVIYRFNAILSKFHLPDVFVETDKQILKFIWKCKGP